MEKAEAPSRKRRIGVSRWLVLLLIVASFFVFRPFQPIMPHVQVPAEAVAGPITLPVVGDLYLTNTMVAMILVDLILLALAISVRRGLRKGGDVPRGVASAVEAILEALYKLTESSAGKWAKTFFPLVATIILVVLVANWSKLLPGVESIGWLHEVHGEGEGYPARELFRLGGVSVSTIYQPEGGGHAAEGEHAYGIIPFVRGLPTDLNFTAALALVSVFMTQIIGLRAAGPGYLKKFFNFGGLFKMWTKDKLGPFETIFPFLDIFVGLLELVAEFAKIISFSFRLFGNLFAGAVLLFISGTLLPIFMPAGVVLFELFVGLIQALVFGMLTLVFMTMATQVHDQHESEGAHGAA